MSPPILAVPVSLCRLKELLHLHCLSVKAGEENPTDWPHRAHKAVTVSPHLVVLPGQAFNAEYLIPPPTAQFPDIAVGDRQPWVRLLSCLLIKAGSCQQVWLSQGLWLSHSLFGDDASATSLYLNSVPPMSLLPAQTARHSHGLFSGSTWHRSQHGLNHTVPGK